MSLRLKERLRKLRFNFIKNSQIGGGKTLLCNNCTGAMVLHDYGLRFDTPTVNLFIRPKDYIELLSDIRRYMQSDIEDITFENKYPVGLLGGKIRIDFLHYSSFAEAVASWKRRAARIDYSHVYAVLVERDGCTYEDLQRFDRLPLVHKVALVHKHYPDIKSSFVINYLGEDGLLGQIIDFQGNFGKRYYDQFDWKHFLEI